MGKFYIRLLLVLLGIGFCIFFGVDLATRGVERIQGPIDKTAVSAPSGTITAKSSQQSTKAQEGKGGDARTEAGKTQTKNEPKAKAKPEEIEPKADISEASGMNLIGNKVGELLQIIAHHGIRWFVSLFQAITG
ncbi:hypothetical protein [Paenibacillus rigui]|uniref:DUF3679 domain-containing protein n=1 Tax=Paenibacillus rigui TaxID=554312 RepID=A0A229USM6_9BACL|nr:hypothetical protein [Paenibacillus rigui]OXM86135.1 hypothetical protein CF651_13040 [Paenibacillus rigui]